MVTENIILEHLEACERTYNLMLEENRLLKSTGAPPAEEFLQRKREALTELENTLAVLRELANPEGGFTTQEKATIQKTQQLVLKALLLDRENEQLLRKSLVVVRPRVPQVRPTLDQIQRLYRKHGMGQEETN